MELSDFIAITLDEIMAGVTKAALKQKESGRYGFINPQDGSQSDAFTSIPISNVTLDLASPLNRHRVARSMLDLM